MANNTQYSKSSPYYQTASVGNYLDVLTPRIFPFKIDDVAYTIDTIYHHRPDLLASDLYGDPGYWWVFAQRNPSVLKDPVFDFEPGVQIYLPKLSAMKRTLGI